MGFEIARLDSTLDLDDGLHGLQNCTSMWVQFWGIIYNIYYIIIMSILSSYTDVQFCNSAIFHQ